MKKLCVLAALALMLLPVSSMAGMTAVEDEDLATISGKTGVTLAMSALSLTFDSFAYADTDGITGTFTTAGWLVMSSITVPSTITIEQLSIDVGYSDTLGATVLQLDLGTDNLVEGNLFIGTISGGTATGGLILGTSSTSGARIGVMSITQMGVKTGQFKLKGHIGG